MDLKLMVVGVIGVLLVISIIKKVKRIIVILILIALIVVAGLYIKENNMDLGAVINYNQYTNVI